MAGVAVITGGRGDLAQATAAALAGRGFDVVHTPGRDELDVRDAGSVAAFFGALDRVDLLVNNAGVIRDAAFARMSIDDWDAVADTNLRGVFLCCRAAAKLMVKQRSGHVVNVGSSSGVRGAAGQANYAAAKAGLIGLTKSLALELGTRSVRVNAVLPGYLRTNLTAHLTEERWAEVIESHALGRLNPVEDAGRFIAFLDSMRQVSGQVFQLDSRVGPWE